MFTVDLIYTLYVYGKSHKSYSETGNTSYIYNYIYNYSMFLLFLFRKAISMFIRGTTIPFYIIKRLKTSSMFIENIFISFYVMLETI